MYELAKKRILEGDGKDTSPSSDIQGGMIADMRKSNDLLLKLNEMLKKQVAQLQGELALLRKADR